MDMHMAAINATPLLRPFLKRCAGLWTVVATCLLGLVLQPAAAQEARDVAAQGAPDARALQARYAALREQLAGSPFGRPLVLMSSEGGDEIQGEVFAIAEQPFERVRQSLESPAQWCGILLLHLNVKGCQTQAQPQAQALSLAVGRRFDQELADAYQVEFRYRLAASRPDYLQVQMNAETGPLGTKNYRLAVEAVAIDARRSFIHMSYAYGYGMAARLAMKTYLSTVGRSKVGFSIAGQDEAGKPVYIGGMRGVIERNAMRYYLAIDAYLKATALPPAEQAQARTREWFDSTERYARQLHEIDREDYLAMKRKELARSDNS